ncbi:MAG: DUF3859 domain-containing protein [Desulfovibrio sp.]|jgi:hypothetical protein
MHRSRYFFVTLCVIGVLLLATAASHAGNPTSAELVDHGVLAGGDGLAGRNVHIVQRTTKIPGRQGLAFGLLFRLQGAVKAPLSYRTVISFRPAPGTHTGGQPRTRIAKTSRAKPGSTQALWHRLDKTQAAQPGQWTLRITSGGRNLLQQTFFVEPEE